MHDFQAGESHHPLISQRQSYKDEILPWEMWYLGSLALKGQEILKPC
jgi:hypothetical protein